jgi:hypothetical protein
MRLVVILVLVIAFAGVLYGLVRSVRYKREQQRLRPDETRAQFRVLAVPFRILAAAATLFPVLLLLQGFVWQSICFFGFAALCWLLAWYAARRAR